MKNCRQLVGLVAALGTLACLEDPLAVENLNNPEAERALASATDVQSLIGSSYNVIHVGHFGSADALWSQLLVMGFENASMNANFNMGARYAIPRSPIFNNRGRQNADDEIRDYSASQRAARLAASGLQRLNQAPCGGAVCPAGEVHFMGSASSNLRARTWAHFVIGVGNGDAGLAYDSAAIVNEQVPERDAGGALFVPPLVSGPTVTRAGIASLDSAIATAAAWGAVAAGASATTDVAWLNRSLTPAQVGQIARSYKARFLAGVARDSTERKNNTDWATVIAAASAGITSDFSLTLSTGAGWINAWFASMRSFDNWHQMPYWFIGMADTSRAYDTWLADPARPKFTICTPDTRFPRGCDRTTQIANSAGGTKTSVQPAGQYFSHHNSGEDFPAASPHAESFYWFARYMQLFNNQNQSPPDWPVFTKAENDLLLAEAYLRTGQLAQGIALINIYRTRNNLLPIPLTAAVIDEVPGLTACVPRVPAPPTFTTTKCGTVFDALKYEKRMETAYSGWGMWFFDGRGWGDLPENTPLHYPVPQQELDARGLPLYFLTGAGHQAPKGNYGF